MNDRFVREKVYSLAKDPLGPAIRYVSLRPRLKIRLLSIIRLFPAFERWLIHKRDEKRYADFSKAWSQNGAPPGAPCPAKAAFDFNIDAHAGKRSVDEVLDRIRKELRQAKGD